ncbi:hypothetical protein FBU59_004029 [Linderina macrospora]|uniref:Uncharacterized protein n=1 Tax=Linderina macrospora TaxID=4868 RepID=A0ACC1J6Y0_9FUNG|nr:hypothetical protein FBU59_004029 [Linderina macrospora]
MVEHLDKDAVALERALTHRVIWIQVEGVQVTSKGWIKVLYLGSLFDKFQVPDRRLLENIQNVIKCVKYRV